MRKKIGAVTFIFILVIVSLSGCGKPRKDEISESLDGQQETASGTNADEATADGGIPEHLSYSVEVGDTVVNVDADVISAGFQNAPIYEVEVIEIDETLIAEYADRLFDESKYEVVKPYSMLSEQEIEAEMRFIMEQIDAYNDATCPKRLSDSLSTLENYKMNYNENNVAELAEGQLIYEEDANQGSYYSARLRGLIDGEQWELFYEAIKGIQSQQSIQIYSCESVMPTDLASMNDESEVWYGENLSNLETSQKTAEDMLNKLGYDNMEVIDTIQLVNRDDKSWMDGYKFVFARSVGTMQIGFNDASLVAHNYEFGVQQEYIHVYATDSSVYMITIDNVIEIGNIMSVGEQKDLMSFEKIDSISRELIEEEMQTYVGDSHPFNIDSVCLKYQVLPLEEGKNKYALIPVWLFYFEQSDGYSHVKFASICINAVDGSRMRTSMPTALLMK